MILVVAKARTWCNNNNEDSCERSSKGKRTRNGKKLQEQGNGRSCSSKDKRDKKKGKSCRTRKREKLLIEELYTR